MKKLTEKYKQWLLTRAINESRRKNHKKGNRSQITLSQWRRNFVRNLSQEEIENELTPSLLKNGVKISPPEIFCLDKNFEEVAFLISELRRIPIRSGKLKSSNNPAVNIFRVTKDTRYIDFRDIKEISPAAALVLAAEYDRARRLSNQPLFTILIDEWDPIVRKRLDDIGFFELLEVDNEIENSETDEDVAIQKFISGNLSDTEGSDKIIIAVNKLTKTLTEKGEIVLNSAVGEAINNACAYAYPDWHKFSSPVTKQWWLTGSADVSNRRLKIVMYDQGLTIPVHFPETKKVEILSLLGGDDDGEVIKKATKLDRTSTGEKQHGKGFQDMKDSIELNNSGRMRVISRNGHYIYEKGQKESSFTNSFPLHGTLIEWEIGVED